MGNDEMQLTDTRPAPQENQISAPGMYDEFIENYLKRLSDLEKPLPEDSNIFLPPRPNNPNEGYVKSNIQVTLNSITEEEKQKLRQEYSECVEGPATDTLTSFPSDTVTPVLDGRGFILPNLLSEEECEEIIKLGEDWGINPEHFVPAERRIRTSWRTDSYVNEELTTRVNKRLPEELLKAIEATAPQTSVRGLHPNWRVARYKEGDTFPAHQDQADSVIVSHPERVRQRYTSSHTLLINLKSPGEDFQGGATRFFMEGTYTGRTVDICLPQGWALAFQQRGLFHAGLPVRAGVKYIAQAGVLRGEPEPGVVTGPTSTFKYAPGIKNY